MPKAGYCSKCGDALIAGKSFCATCGKSVGNEVAVETAAPISAGENRRINPRIWWAIVALVLIVVTGFVVGTTVVVRQNHAARTADLEKVYEAVVGVRSATDIGVTYEDYGKRLRDADAALAVYKPEDNNAKAIAAHLASALTLYKVANDVWDTKFENSPARAFVDFTESYSELDLSYSADSSMQDLWSEASVEMDAAEAGFKEY